MEQKWNKVFESMVFMMAILAGVCSILSVKICLMTGQMIYLGVAFSAFMVLMICVCRRPKSES